MQRTVTSDIVLTAESPARLALLVSVAAVPGLGLEEDLRVSVDGAAHEVRELRGPHGTRLHLVDAPVGEVSIAYRASVTGRGDPAPGSDIDLLTYLRPSRYAESDRLAVVARAEFADLEGEELVHAVAAWVGKRLIYASGTSRVVDSAVDTLLAGQGVCRDFTHLVIAMLRARDVPARMVAAYAPGVKPMDFHAVAEAHVGGRWVAVDSTGLAPRSSLVRIATGHDAADTAFLTSHRGVVRLLEMNVTAVVEGDLPDDDGSDLVALG